MSIGYHMSINKKLLSRSLINELSLNPFCRTFQIFLKSPQKYSNCSISEEDILKSSKLIKEKNLEIFVHSSYLINIGNIMEEKIRLNILDDFTIGEKIGAKGVIFHVGKHCKRFTEFYYKIVIEYNDLFEENPINQNNLNTSKNFIISCYNQFSTNYDTKLKEKVKTLTNLAGDIEIFEL